MDTIAKNICQPEILSLMILVPVGSVLKILTGDLNAGDLNAGDLNVGDLITGDLNAGDLNARDLYAGDLNVGDLNAGDLNVGSSTIFHFLRTFVWSHNF